jgi:hypothetical protein
MSSNSAPTNGQSNSQANGNDLDTSQLSDYQVDRNAKSQDVVYTTSNGVPMPHPYQTQRAGAAGPLLLQDFHLIDLLSHFDRERIPERVVHAKGSGAHGIWECTDSLEDLCLASMFKKGAKVPLSTRFSTVGGESGTPDLARFVLVSMPCHPLTDPPAIPADSLSSSRPMRATGILSPTTQYAQCLCCHLGR